MLTKARAIKLRKLIAIHVFAQIELNEIGSKAPEEHYEIKDKADKAKQNLWAFIKEEERQWL